MILTADHLITAHAMMERVLPAMASVFNAVGRNELHAVGNKVLELLAMHNGSLAEKQVIMALGAQANTRELYEIFDHLKKTDQIVKFDLKDEKTGVVRSYLATPARYRQVTAALSAKTAAP